MSIKAVTSQRVASEASDILRKPMYGAKEKSVAGSALAQTPEKNILKRLVLARYRPPVETPGSPLSALGLSTRYRTGKC